MATKPTPPALRSGRNELGGISSAASAAYNERLPALQAGLTTGTRTNAAAASAARIRELGQLQRYMQANISPTTDAVRAEYGAITDRLGQSNALENQMRGTAMTALNDPTAYNPVLGALSQEALAGDSEILRTLQGQALTDLNLGRSLSPEEQMQAQQAARAGFAARGMATGTPAATAEVLNRDAFATQRQDARRGFGINVENLGNQSKGFRLGVGGLYQGAVDSGRQFALGTNSQTLQREGMRADAATRQAGFNWMSSPGVMALQQQSMVPMSMQSALQTNQQADVYPQTMGYMQDVNNTNFNAQESRYLGNLNRYYAQKYGGYGATSGGANNSAIGGAIGMGVGMGAGALIGSNFGPGGATAGARLGAALGGATGTAAGGIF
jgi:hypothetical protein